jgi:hypothetical protein
MVLSPIEPVAPNTVTLRTPEAAGLLLRYGTGLIASPNHKTATDAIDAIPQKSNNGSQNDGRDKSVKPVQYPAVAGNYVT